MLKTKIIHPELLKVLASAGHGSKIIIADGNFPVATGANPNIPRIYLNFSPGMMGVPDVLRGLVETVPLEAAMAAAPEDGPEPEIFAEYREILPKDIDIIKLDRFGFYDTVRSPETAVIIATGEKRVYSCIALTIGVRKS